MVSILTAIKKAFKEDKSMIIGVILIILALFILTTDFLDNTITSLLWIILEGSSEGKTVMFLVLLGVLLIITSTLRHYPRFIKKFNDPTGNKKYLKYIAYMMIIMFICALIGLVIEAYIRMSYNVSFFTILTSMENVTSTTSPMHSHLYKSVLGYITSRFAPVHINTAASIQQFSLPYSLIIIPLISISFILGVIGITNLKPIHRYMSIFAFTLMIIGLFDGGIFSQPFLIGLMIMLIVYNAKERYGIKYLINPIVIMGLILLLAFIIELGGTNPEYHTLTVINQTEPIDMTKYNITNVIQDGDKTIYTINSTMTDKELITQIFNSFDHKCSATFMTWDFYSYLENPTMKQRQEQKYGYPL